MLLIRAIVRPEKKDEVLTSLWAEGFPAATIVDVVGRGKQKGLKVGNVVYDEIPKTMIHGSHPRRAEEHHNQHHPENGQDRRERDFR